MSRGAIAGKEFSSRGLLLTTVVFLKVYHFLQGAFCDLLEETFARHYNYRRRFFYFDEGHCLLSSLGVDFGRILALGVLLTAPTVAYELETFYGLFRVS